VLAWHRAIPWSIPQVMAVHCRPVYRLLGLSHARVLWLEPQDPQWWLGTASNATVAAMSEMGRQSTRLVADVIFTAWVLAQNDTVALANSTERDADTSSGVPSIAAHTLSDMAWAQKVQSAAEQDRISR
jgi:hypothetical protein